MEAEVLEKTETIANFLRTDQKCPDWRYQTYRKLKYHKKESEVIHWIGIIKLEDLKENDPACRIHYVNQAWKMVPDQERSRDVDGAELEGYFDMPYHIGSIMPYLEAAKFAGVQYFQVLLEEKVDNTGAHSVTLLHFPNKEGDTGEIYGVSSNQVWSEQSVKQWSYYASRPIGEDVVKTYLLSHHSYRWMK